MPRIISKELNNKLRQEYRLRFFALLFITLFAVIIINILLVSSSYLLLTLYEKAYTTSDSFKRNDELSQINKNFNTKLAQVYSLTKKIPVQSNDLAIKVSTILFEYANKGIDLNAIEIVQTTNVSNITLRGVALTREDALLFQDKIKQDVRFKDFSIPIESLTKQRDISLNANFTYHEN